MKIVAAVVLCALWLFPTHCARAGYDDDLRICGGREYHASAAACTRLLESGRKGLDAGRVYFARAQARFEFSDYDGSVSDATEAIRLLGPRKELFNTRGLAWLRKGESERALSDFAEAQRLDPKDSGPHVNRGWVYWGLRDYDRQIEELNIAIRLAPRYAEAYRGRGTAWLYKGDYDRAFEDIDRAVKLDPKSNLARVNRGQIWMMKGDIDRAIPELDAAIRICAEINDPPIYEYTVRGDLFRYKGDYQRALGDYDAALFLLKDYIPAFTGKGLTYERMGKLDLARIEFNKAIQSQSVERNANASAEYLRTAQAHLAALDAGAEPPVIPIIASAPAKATSIPTPEVQPAKPVASRPRTGRRVALVIGNSAYANVPALTNPEKDASAVAATLRNIGFDVVNLVTNTAREKLVNALRDFANEAEKSDWAMVYYAGHGMEVGGVNYLIPIDAKLAVDRDIQYEAVPLTQVLNAADAAKKIKLVMLDACRDNPFTPRKTAAPETVAASTAGAPITTRSTNGRGLAEVKVTGATLVVYAAKDGQVALDGEGGNSPFAIAVVQRIATPGVEINKVFRLVRDDVMEATGGRQEPYTYGSLPGKEDFYFVEK